jgi:hypothetical protein
VIERLPSTCEVLDSIPSTTKKTTFCCLCVFETGSHYLAQTVVELHAEALSPKKSQVLRTAEQKAGWKQSGGLGEGGRDLNSGLTL